MQTTKVTCWHCHSKPSHIITRFRRLPLPAIASILLSRLLVAQHVDRGVPHAAALSAQLLACSVACLSSRSLLDSHSLMCNLDWVGYGSRKWMICSCGRMPLSCAPIAPRAVSGLASGWLLVWFFFDMPRYSGLLMCLPGPQFNFSLLFLPTQHPPHHAPSAPRDHRTTGPRT